MAHHPLGSGDAVYPVPRMKYLRGRQNVGFVGERGHAADDRDVGLAVEKDLFDVVLEIHVLRSRLPFAENRVHRGTHATEVENAYVTHLVAAGRHVMRLDVEDEVILTPFLNRSGLGELGGVNVEELPKDLVHRGESSGHAAGGVEERPPVDAELSGRASTQHVNAVLDRPL